MRKEKERMEKQMNEGTTRKSERRIGSITETVG